MDLKIFLFLIAATSLETVGDAIVRVGIGQTAWLPRSALFLAGALFLFGYGVSLNLAPIGFGRVVGLYIATLFIMWQLVNLIVFRSPPGMPVLIGGLLIVVGGLIVTFWE
jgi:small multidrug resistance family-3 protein